MENKVVFYLHAAAAFQYLNAALQFNIFEEIEAKGGAADFEALKESSKLPEASLKCLLFGLKSMDLVHEENGLYRNATDVNYFFQNKQFELIKAMNDLQSEIVYLGLNEFVPSLKEGTNEGIKFFKGQGETLYQRLSESQQVTDVFYNYMESYSEYAIQFLLDRVSFHKDKKILDVGGGMGANAISIAKKFPNASVTIADLRTIEQDVNKRLHEMQVEERVAFAPTDFFKDELPDGQDTVMFIHQLVIWSKEDNIMLLKKAYNSLNENGRVIIYSSMAADNYAGPIMAALDSVYFKSVATGDGLIYSYSDYEDMLTDAGFTDVQKINCNTWTPHGIVIGSKMNGNGNGNGNGHHG